MTEVPEPMLLDERKVAPFSEPGWIYEIKFDGYRLMALVDRMPNLQGQLVDRTGDLQGRVKLMTRGGADATKWFPEVAAGLAQLPGGPHVLDGEACVLDDLGRSDFNRLHERARRRRWYDGADPVVFCAFDLLVASGRSLMAKPVEDRKARLAKLLSPAPPAALFVGHFTAEEGRQLFEHAKELKLEGLVAKRLGSVYRPGVRTLDWVKVKRKGAIPPERFKR